MNDERPSTSWKAHILVALAVLAIGYMFGSMSGVATPAHADIRKTPAREAFQSGGERSEVVLREIAGILKRMDKRLERIERAVTQSNKAVPARNQRSRSL